MKKDNYNTLAKQIMLALGGVDNVIKLFHCATRLRFDLKDISIVDIEELKKSEGVLGVVESVGGVQVIIGNNVSKVYSTIMNLYEIDSGQNANKTLENNQNVFTKILNVLSAVIGPAIPLIMSSGLISALLVILTKLGLDTKSTTYILMNMIANGALYLLPIILAYSSAKKFGCDILVSLFLGGMMLSPTLLSLVQGGDAITLFGLPVKSVDYSSTLIPIVLTIFVFSYIDKWVEQCIPETIKFVFCTFIKIIIMIPVTFCLTGPIGSYLGDGLCAIMTTINNVAPWSSVLIIGSLAPLLMLTGMHLALIPLVMTSLSTVGFDNMLFVAFIGMNFSQFGVSLACLLKSKKSSLKTLASSCALTCFLSGVAEPSLYGICVRMKKPLVATWITCIVNAIYCAIFGVKVYSFGAPSFFTMPIFLNPDGTMSNFYFAIGAVILTIIVSFVSTWIIGFDDSVYE